MTYLVEVIHEDLCGDEGLVELGAELALDDGVAENFRQFVYLLHQVTDFVPPLFVKNGDAKLSAGGHCGSPQPLAVGAKKHLFIDSVV